MARRDGDTPGTQGDWDPATGVRLAAALGAAARAVATNKGVMNDVFAEPLVRAAGLQYCIELIDNEVHADARWDPLMAGFLNVLATQSRFLDHFLARVVRAGIRQAVILASGLDTRPYRLWWPPRTTVYEIDEPDVVDFKAGVLRGLGAQLTVSRCAIGVHLDQDWPAALHRVGFDAAQPTVWIAEGLFVGYLAPDAQNQFLQTVSSLSAAGSRLGADHMPGRTPWLLEEGKPIVDRFLRGGLDVDQERMISRGEYHFVPKYLATQGWHPIEYTVADVFTAMGMTKMAGELPSTAANMPSCVTAVLD